MENEEIMMNETSTEDMVPVEDNALVDTESGYEESSENSSIAAKAVLVGGCVMAVVGTVHVFKRYVVPGAVKVWNFAVSKFSKGKVVEAESTESTEEEAEDTVTE